MKLGTMVLILVTAFGLALGHPAGVPITPDAGPDECGFEAALGAHLARYEEGDFSRKPRPVLSGPVAFVVKPHVKVHYTTEGEDGTTQAYAESVAVYAEHCWAVFTGLGWLPPPPDQGVGGDDRYDIYIRSTNNIEAYGQCVPDSQYTDPYPNGRSSWVEVTCDPIPQPFPQYARLRALVAHELHHAFQVRCNVLDQIWIYENTSVYAEGIAYDDVKTIPYRCTVGSDPLNNPELQITYTHNLYHYAGAIWMVFLHENYSIGCPRRVWERIGERGTGAIALGAIDWVLRNTYQSTLNEALGEYAVWRYFTGPERGDPLYYFSESLLWPASEVLRTHNFYPASGDQGTRAPSGPGGANFIKFTSGSDDLLEVTLDGHDHVSWAAHLVGYRYPRQSVEREIELDANWQGTGEIAWQDNDHLALIATVTQWDPPGLNMTHTYQAEEAQSREWAQAPTSWPMWRERAWHTAVSFDDKLWVLGGWGDMPLNDVWYSIDGTRWTQATGSAAWSPRFGHASVVYDGKIWVVGGQNSTGYYENDAWYSTDGVNWNCATASAGWRARTGHTSVVFGDRIWVLGGWDGYFTKNDVWHSTDGANWTQSTDSAGWTPRDRHASAASGNRIWVFGGQEILWPDVNNDVWYSTDGANWICATPSAEWSPRIELASVFHNNKVWVLGGADPLHGLRNDVWYAGDGSVWTQATASAGWSGRQGHSSIVFDGRTWVLGGISIDGNEKNDVWHSGGPESPQPRIWTSPRYLTISLWSNAVRDTVLRLFNNGDADLQWSVAKDPPVSWLAITPTSGTVPPRPNNRMDLTLSFNTAGLDAGFHHTNLVFTSNDPDRPEKNVSVELYVRPSYVRVLPPVALDSSGAGFAESPAGEVLPTVFALGSGYPSPFVSQAAISYALPQSSPVELRVYSPAGVLVRTLRSGHEPAGFHRIAWDGRDEQGRSLSAGVYLVRFTASDFTATRKVVKTE